MEAQILSSLKTIFKEVFDDDSIEVNMSTTADDIVEWDSITHIELIVTVEKKFNVRFKSSDLPRLGNVGDLVHLIQHNSRVI